MRQGGGGGLARAPKLQRSAWTLLEAWLRQALVSVSSPSATLWRLETFGVAGRGAGLDGLRAPPPLLRLSVAGRHCTRLGKFLLRAHVSVSDCTGQGSWTKQLESPRFGGRDAGEGGKSLLATASIRLEK